MTPSSTPLFCVVHTEKCFVFSSACVETVFRHPFSLISQIPYPYVRDGNSLSHHTAIQNGWSGASYGNSGGAAHCGPMRMM